MSGRTRSEVLVKLVDLLLQVGRGAVPADVGRVRGDLRHKLPAPGGPGGGAAKHQTGVAR